MSKLFLFALVLLALMGCQIPLTLPTAVNTRTPEPTAISPNVLPSAATVTRATIPHETPLAKQPAPYLIVTWAWFMDTQPALTQKKFKFAVHAVELTPQETIVIYSAAGKRTDKLLTSKKVKLVDDIGGSYTLVRRTPLAQFGRVEIGALVFEPRQSGVTTLRLTFNPTKEDESWKLHVGRQYDAPEKASFIEAGYTGAAYREEYLDQAGSRISFNGWYLQKEDRVAKTHLPGMTDEESIAYSATRAAEFDALELSDEELTADTPEGVKLARANGVRTEMTLRVEALKSKQVQYVYVVIDGAGQVHASVLE